MNFSEQDHSSAVPVLFSHKDLVLLIIPLMIEQTLTSLMGVADTLMVSAAGESAISGVTCVDAVNVLLLLVFEAIGVGGSVLAAQYTGREDHVAVRSTVRQLMTFQLFFSGLLTVLLLCFAPGIIHLLYPSLEADVYTNALIYFRITAVSCPFLALYTASAAFYRSVGNAKLPVIVITTGNLLNIAGNAVLIFIFQLGAAGAAWATLGSRIFSCVVLLTLQARPGVDISLHGLNQIPFSFSETGRILRIGLPTALENGMFQLGKIVVQTIVVTFGTTAIAAQAIISQIETLASRPGLAVGVALLTVAGQYIGAGYPEKARYYAIRFTLLAHILCAVTGIITVLLIHPVCSLTALSVDAAELVLRLTVFIAIAKVFLWPGAFILQYCLKAAGDVKYPMWVAILSMWIFRVAGSLILCNVFHLGLWGVWIAWMADWVIRTIFFWRRLLQGRWQAIRL